MFIRGSPQSGMFFVPHLLKCKMGRVCATDHTVSDDVFQWVHQGGKSAKLWTSSFNVDET